MRLALVISQLEAGGAERVMSTLASYWADHGHDVTLITFWSASSDAYPLSPRIKRIALGLGNQSATRRQSLTANWQRARALRRTLRSACPQAVISFMDTTNMITLLATRGLGVPVIVSERTHPAHHAIGAMRNCARRRLYPLAEAVVAPSNGVGDWLAGFLRREAVHVIPNPVRPARGGAGRKPADRSGDRVVVAMGRLDAAKQIDYLLRAFALCRPHHTDWCLAVMGDGPERRNLETLAAELGIADKVRWMGMVAEPTEVLNHADLFVMSSRYEGFPNALLEAMACGLASVSFDCPSGPGEIIRHGIDGFLIPPQDLEGLAAAMGTLMGDETLRKRLASRASEVGDRFSLQSVGRAWEQVIRGVSTQPDDSDAGA